MKKEPEREPKPYTSFPEIMGRFKVKKAPIRTRHFDEVYYIFCEQNGNEFACAELKCHPPAHSVLKSDAGMLKIENRFLYATGLKDLVNELLTTFGLKFIHVTRCDIAIDFPQFKNNLKPEVFIRRFLNEKYTKLRNCKGGNIWEQNRKLKHSYIRFQSRTSALCYYMYDKTKELREMKDKPYIREHWQNCDMPPNENIWRLEFRIMSSGKGIAEADRSRVIKDAQRAEKILADVKRLKQFDKPILPQLQNKIQWAEEMREVYKANKDELFEGSKLFRSLDILDHYHEIFCALYHHYFDFRHEDGQAKKCRMKKIPLLDIAKPSVNVMRLVEKIESNKTSKVFLKMLTEVASELRGKDFHLNVEMQKIISHFTHSRDLLAWLEKKLPEEYERLTVPAIRAGYESSSVTHVP